MALSLCGQAASYERRSEIQQNIGIKLIGKLNIDRGSTVLDLGCGTGYLTKLLSDKVGPEGKVVAVDPDSERLKIAREKYAANNIDYIQADADTFPVANYNLIYCNQAIHWFSDIKGALKRVFDNLSPGGQFAFTTAYNIESSTKVEEYKLMDRIFGPDIYNKIVVSRLTFLREEEYKILAVDCGFSQVIMDTDTQMHEWETIDDVIDALHGWWQGILDISNTNDKIFQEIKKECEEKGGPALKMYRTYLYVILTK